MVETKHIFILQNEMSDSNLSDTSYCNGREWRPYIQYLLNSIMYSANKDRLHVVITECNSLFNISIVFELGSILVSGSKV